jgi:ribonucleoside-diphosphate reductase alpha subunit
MKVLKRTNDLQDVSFDKILKRISIFCKDLNSVQPDLLAQQTISKIYNGISTKEIDDITCQLAVGMSLREPEYSTLAGRLSVSNHHKNTLGVFSEKMEVLFIDGLVSQDFINVVRKYETELNNTIDYELDYSYSYVGLENLKNGYLLKSSEGKIIERPQDMLMRVSVGIHFYDLENVLKSYDKMSKMYFTHASPTLFNAGGNFSQLSSCFHKDSVIGTMNKGPICIKDVQVDDVVITHSGNVRKVDAVYENKLNKRTIVEMKVAGSESLRLTEDHKMYVAQVIDNTIKTSWMSVLDIDHNNKTKISDYYVCIPNNKSITYTYKYSDAYLKFMGVYLMYGSPLVVDGELVGIKMLKMPRELYNFVKVYFKVKGISFFEYTECISTYYNEFENKKFFLEKDIIELFSLGKDTVKTFFRWIREYPVSLKKIDKTLKNNIYHLLRNNSIEVNYDYLFGNSTDFLVKDTIHYKGDTFLKYIGHEDYSSEEQNVYTFCINGPEHSYNVGGLVAKNCYLLGTHDSIEGIFKTITDTAKISKWGGGIGIHVSNIRTNGALIKKTNGKTDGIVPMLKVYNDVSRYINQGGKRKGAIAIYLEPWNADIYDFLDLKKNQGDENLRARDIFTALFINDIFMESVLNDKDWYLMCPNDCPGLVDAYGSKFNELYNNYITQKRYKKVVKATDLFKKIIQSQIETGVPYMSFKDAVNEKCNQKNIGTIKSLNLCCEVTLFSDENEYGVCNIATLSLPKFVKNNEFDFKTMGEVVGVMVENLNNIIDVNYNPVEEARISNEKNRPIIIGVQGLYDVFVKLKLPMTGKHAQQLNKDIFEAIYYYALEKSCDLAIKNGPYSTYEGSPISKGLFQFNLWGLNEKELKMDWKKLRERILKHGVRNSMVTGLPPTVSTSQIMGNTESFEPLTTNLFTRNLISGTFPVINNSLVKDLKELGLWNEDIQNEIIVNNGSIQNIIDIPKHIKDLYKTIWEIKQKDLVKMSADRGPFIDHSQSLNIYIDAPTISKLASCHMYSWKLGLKTGMYYLRTKPPSTAEKFTACPIDAGPDCKMCSG